MSPNKWLKAAGKEWLLLLSVAGLAVTSAYTGAFPSLSASEMQVLFILFVLFIAVKGLENSGLFLKLALSVERGNHIPLKLVLVTFFMSMLVTNDVALIVIVPLTLLLNVVRKDILVIIEALAANAGSAMTPLGNPQNLFIYWYYDIHPVAFVLTIAPLSLGFFAILVLCSFFIRLKNGTATASPPPVVIHRSAYLFAALLLIAVLMVLRVVPVGAGTMVIAGAAVASRRSLFVDYALLLTFVCFFAIAENMKSLLAPIPPHTGHVFFLSAMTSQIISNVPAALLFAKLTTQWKALLWGTNVGGFGSLIGSLANLIAYRLYVTNKNTRHPVGFTVKFLVMGYLAFIAGLGLYAALGRMI